MEPLSPIGFWSYATQDERATGAGLPSDLHRRVSSALKSHVGREDVDIFLDTSTLREGDAWERKIVESLEKANFFIPILTPGFFGSAWCLKEVRLFLDVEKTRGHGDLIFPIHFNTFAEQKNAPRKPAEGAQEIFEILRERQWSDFRRYRIEGFDSKDAARLIDSMAKAIDDALVRTQVIPVSSVITPAPVPDPVVASSVVASSVEAAPTNTAPEPAERVLGQEPTTQRLTAEAPPRSKSKLGLFAAGVFGLAVGAGSAVAIVGFPSGVAAQTKGTATLLTELDAAKNALNDANARLSTANGKLVESQRAWALAQGALNAAIADRMKADEQAAGDIKAANDRRAMVEKERDAARLAQKNADDLLKVANEKFSTADKARSAAVEALKDATATYTQQRAALEKERDEARDKLAEAKKTSQTPTTAQGFAIPPPGGAFREPGHPKFPEMVVIPTGTFVMGSAKDPKDPDYEKHRWGDDEGPAHKVTVKSFAAGRTHVTVEEFREFAIKTNHRTDDKCQVWTGSAWEEKAGLSWENPGFPNSVGYGNAHPVACVSWNDAVAYVAWLNKDIPGKPYRLLTEEEWEYSARAQTTIGKDKRTEFWTGATIGDKQAQYNWALDIEGKETKTLAPLGTAPVGSFPANGFGLRDMHGNLWQWVQDCYKEDAYTSPPKDGKAVEMPNCTYRVLRGGSWFSNPGYLRSAGRFGTLPSVRASWFGVRVARTL